MRTLSAVLLALTGLSGCAVYNGPYEPYEQGQPPPVVYGAPGFGQSAAPFYRHGVPGSYGTYGAYGGYGAPGYDRGGRGHGLWGYGPHGVPNQIERDRDGDGVPNRLDRRPNNPRRF